MSRSITIRLLIIVSQFSDRPASRSVPGQMIIPETYAICSWYNESVLRLFAYGTLMIEEIMETVTGRTFKSSDALLRGHVRYCIRDVLYPGIIKNKGSVVRGTVYYDIDDETMRRLDAFEDDIYERVAVEIITDDGNRLDAYTYRISERYESVLTAEVWEPEAFREKHMRSFIERYGGFGSR
jgi:gamma-glutamylcyclotransferase (GGCT)/AIG2-like uncharacterized protein YtfP